MQVIETDYLIVGAGAAGMAFADSLIAECHVDVVRVERRRCPGSHWKDAYPFVSIHHALASWTLNSRFPLFVFPAAARSLQSLRLRLMHARKGHAQQR